jgi:hypothetical protein
MQKYSQFRKILQKDMKIHIITPITIIVPFVNSEVTRLVYNSESKSHIPIQRKNQY